MGKRTPFSKTAARHVRSSTEEKYRDAMELYRTSNLSTKHICELTHTKLSGFRAYVQRYQREAMYARHGVPVDASDADASRLRKSHGQTKTAYEKYKEAIRACDDIAYVEYNISQIARMFHLDPTSLGNQLRAHYPEILERRARERERLGIRDNQQRGARPQSKKYYSEAVRQLWTTDKTIGEVARELGVSQSGLHEHLLFYHKKLIRHRADKRMRACARKVHGALMGNGSCHVPSAAILEKYRDAVRLYSTTSLTLQKIAEMTGVSAEGLRNHLHTWHKELIFARRGIDYQKGSGLQLSQTKHYLKSTSEKYAKAIAELKNSSCSTAHVAARYGLHAECFRSYLREHEPELYARKGMKRTDDGRLVLRQCEEKYGEAVRAYETSTESLRSIARRFGLQYNSLGGFIRRNFPDVITRHNELVKQRS